MPTNADIVRRILGDNGQLNWTGNRWSEKYFVRLKSGTEWSAYEASIGDDGAGNTVPARGSSHGEDTLALVREINVNQMPGGEARDWEVTLTYDTRTPFAGFGQGFIIPSGAPEYADDPVNEPWKIIYDSDDIEEVIEEDESSPAKDIVNSAGQPFDPPVTRPRALGTLSVERNVNTIDIKAVQQLYLNKVNDAVWAGEAEATVLCKKIRAEAQYGNGKWYAKVNYFFLIDREKTWRRKVLDMGRGVVSNGRLLVASDEDLRQYTEPVKLDGAGAILEPPTAKGIYIPQSGGFMFYAEVGFSGLGLT